LLAALRARLREHARDDAAVAHATAREGLLIVRLLADDAAILRHALIHAAGALRALAAGYSVRLPQVWYC